MMCGAFMASNFCGKCLQSFKPVEPQDFEVRKKSLQRHFHEKITSRASSKHGPCLINDIANIFVVLNLIKLHNGNSLLKINDRFGADL